MPARKFKMRLAVPEIVRKYRTFSPTEIADKLLRDYNKGYTPQAITVFFKRNPQIEKELRKEVYAEESEQIEVTPSIFKSGTFENLPSIKKWNNEQATRISKDFQKSQVDAVKRICQGVYYSRDPITKKIKKHKIENWALKSPERLTIDHVKEFIAAVHTDPTVRTTKGYRLAARAFFYSRDGITVKPQDISGEMGKIGKWKRVFVEKPILTKILDYVKQRNRQAYAASLFAFKTATRATATFDYGGKKGGLVETKEKDGSIYREMYVLDKGFHRKGRLEWYKVVTPDLYDELQYLWYKHGDDAFKGLDQQETRNLLKEAYEIYLKNDPKAYELAMAEPFHFWRHMFAQHMLRATDYNYTAVAELGGWSSDEMLKKVYGAPAKEKIKQWGLSAIPKI